MKRLAAIFLLLSSVAWAQSEFSTDSPVDFSHRTVRGVSINLVSIDLNSKAIEIRPILAPEGSTLPLQTLINQGDGVYAAITGTFFDPATAITVGNVVHNGRLMTEGSVGSVLSIGDDGTTSVRSLEGKMGRHIDWTGTKFAISAGPTLLTQGEVTIAPSSEGFRDPGLYGARMRAAMGVTPQNKLLLLTSRQPVTLHTLAGIFKDLGAVDAVNLDGGSSTALYHAGSVVSRPYRSLTNLIGIYAAGTAPDLSAGLSTQYAQAYTHYLKGAKLFKEGALLQARSQVRKAVSMAPDRPPYWETLAQIQERENNLPEAAQSFLRAAELFAERSQDQHTVRCAQAGFRLDPGLRQNYPQLSQLVPLTADSQNSNIVTIPAVR